MTVLLLMLMLMLLVLVLLHWREVDAQLVPGNLVTLFHFPVWTVGGGVDIEPLLAIDPLWDGPCSDNLLQNGSISITLLRAFSISIAPHK